MSFLCVPILMDGSSAGTLLSDAQPHLVPLHARAKELLQQYEAVDLQHVPREQNVDADALVNAALDAAGAPSSEAAVAPDARA